MRGLMRYHGGRARLGRAIGHVESRGALPGEFGESSEFGEVGR